MDSFTVFVGLVVLSAVGGVLWSVFIIWAAVKTFEAVSQQLDGELAQIRRTLQQVAAVQGAEHRGTA
jgi:divalent metal cation (Fe/Co/Zn/Cd) transporter